MKKKLATLYDRNRMCKHFHEKLCKGCPLETNCKYEVLTDEEFDKINSLIVEWCENNKEYTIQDKVLEIFPKCEVNIDLNTGNKTLSICPCKFFGKDVVTIDECNMFANCSECKEKFWNKPLSYLKSGLIKLY